MIKILVAEIMFNCLFSKLIEFNHIIDIVAVCIRYTSSWLSVEQIQKFQVDTHCSFKKWMTFIKKQNNWRYILGKENMVREPTMLYIQDFEWLHTDHWIKSSWASSQVMKKHSFRWRLWLGQQWKCVIMAKWPGWKPEKILFICSPGKSTLCRDHWFENNYILRMTRFFGWIIFRCIQ